jgi:hypothetical protein
VNAALQSAKRRRDILTLKAKAAAIQQVSAGWSLAKHRQTDTRIRAIRQENADISGAQTASGIAAKLEWSDRLRRAAVVNQIALDRQLARFQTCQTEHLLRKKQSEDASRYLLKEQDKQNMVNFLPDNRKGRVE